MKKVFLVVLLASSMVLASGCSIIDSLKTVSGDRTEKSRGSGEEILLNDYLTYEVSGYDGEGVISFSIDYEGIVADNDAISELSPSRLEDKISGEFDRYDGLKNGDIVGFAWDVQGVEKIESKYGVEFEYKGFEVTVENLKAKNEFDPFSYMDIAFSGEEGDASVSIPEADTPIGRIRYLTDSSLDISNGDSIEVVAVLVSGEDLGKSCEVHDLKLVGDKTTVLVSGLDKRSLNFDDYFYINDKHYLQIKNVSSETESKLNKVLSSVVVDKVSSADTFGQEYYLYKNTDTIFSLVVHTIYDCDCDTIEAFTIDTATGKLLTSREVFALSGMSEDEYYSTAVKATETAQNNRWPNSVVNGKFNPKSNYSALFPDKKSVEKFNAMFTKKFVDIDKTNMFLDSDGRLVLIKEFFTNAGSDSLFVTYDLEGNVYGTMDWEQEASLAYKSNRVYKLVVEVRGEYAVGKGFKTYEVFRESKVIAPDANAAEIKCSNVTASSYLTSKDGTKYPPKLTIDGNLKTAWNVTRNNGLGESLTYSFAPGTYIRDIFIVPGYTKSEKIFKANYVPTEMVVSSGNQKYYLDLSYPAGSYSLAKKGLKITLPDWLYLEDGNLTITVINSNEGNKYKECCISEVKFYGVNP